MKYKFDRKVTKELLKDKGTYAFVLLVIILSYLPEGEDDLADIDTETLFAELEEEFECNIPEENENKINAVITALTTDLFWKSSSVNKAISMAFADGDIGDIINGNDEEVEACYLIWALLEVGILHDLSLAESVNQCNDSVINYINEVLDDEAEDKDSEVDEIDEVMRDPYYHKYISYNLLQLSGQLLHLGADTKTVAEMWQQYINSIDTLAQPEDNPVA